MSKPLARRKHTQAEAAEPMALDAHHSEREEGAFWDSNSPLDHPEQWVESEEVKAERPLSHILAVRLDARTVDRLATLARRKGIGPSTLARMWLLERLTELEETEDRANKQASANREP